MFAKSRKVTLMITAVLALVMLAGCTGTNGGGTVTLLEGETGNGTFVAGEATIAVSATCNDHKDGFRSTLHVTDNNNGANFTAILPWTPVANIAADYTDADFSTCEEAAAYMEANGFSAAGGLINSQGQEVGTAGVLVGAPGSLPGVCGDLQPLQIGAIGPDDVLPGGFYAAYGCLDQGKINFQ